MSSTRSKLYFSLLWENLQCCLRFFFAMHTNAQRLHLMSFTLSWLSRCDFKLRANLNFTEQMWHLRSWTSSCFCFMCVKRSVRVLNSFEQFLQFNFLRVFANFPWRARFWWISSAQFALKTCLHSSHGLWFWLDWWTSKRWRSSKGLHLNDFLQ